jgi:tetratricopeptide (TPR) repeat protein
LARDPTSSESYIALRNALIAIQGDESALRSILTSLSDSGAGWVKLAYCELRRTLVQGRVKEAETIGGLIGGILDIREQGIEDELAENRIHADSMKWVTDGIESIMAQDNRSGMTHLERLTEAVYSDESLQWVAWHWLSVAASDEGELTRAKKAAAEAMDLAEGLDRQAQGVSHVRCGEIEFALGDSDAAEGHLQKGSAAFDEIGDRRGMAMASLTMARMLAILGRHEDAERVALSAQAADADWEEPAVFLSRAALVRGDLARAADVIAPFFEFESRSPDVDRQRRLIKAVVDGGVSVEVITHFLKLKDMPPGKEVVMGLEELQQAHPEFHDLREALAWNLVKVGREAEAAEHFKEMAYLDLDPELQSSVLLGLGMLANRQHRGEQTGKRVRAASSSFKRSEAAASLADPIPDEEPSLEIVVEENPDGDIPVIEVSPDPPPPPPLPAQGRATTKMETLDEALDASFEFGEPEQTSEVNSIQDALDASFEFSAESGMAAAEPAGTPSEPKASEAPESMRKRMTTGDAIEALPDDVPRPAPKPAPAPGMPSMVPKVQPKPVFTGDLQLFAVPDLLDFLESSRRTGTLLITTEDGIGAVYLHQGRITGAASPNGANMGDLLMESGAITDEQLQQAVQHQKSDSPNQLLGTIMVELGLVDSAALQEALVKQVKGALLEMVVWTQGRFAFEPDKQEQGGGADLEIELETRGVLLDVLRQLDEQNR